MIHKRKKQRRLEIERADFKWETNPLLTEIRVRGNGIFQEAAATNKAYGITEFDVAIQTMIHLAGFPPERVWRGIDKTILEVAKNIKLKNSCKVAEMLNKAISKDKVNLDLRLVRFEALRQVERLKDIYSHGTNINGKIVTLPAKYMGNPNYSPFKSIEARISTKGKKILIDSGTGETQLVVKEMSSDIEVIMKKVPIEISRLYKLGFHYLHAEPKDEIEAYGAYIKDEKMPFAWVSYSPVWREYKKKMLNYFGIESHCVVEMTRAWNSIWSPKNTMSVLFSFAHNQLRKQWKKNVDTGKEDKPLAGVITSINGNMGFHANAFRGVGFEVAGLKPSNFTYYKDEHGYLTYIPRRKLAQKLELKGEEELITNLNFESSRFPLLPTYEMILLFDQNARAKLSKRPIYRIPDDDYLKT